MRRTALLLLLVVPLLLGLPAGAAPGPSPMPSLRDEAPVDCEQFVPPSALPARLTAPSSTPAIRLDLLVLVERRLLTPARTAVELAARSYAEVGIALRPRYQLLRSVPDLDGDSQAYLDWTKSLFRDRQRPRGVDAVYLATDRYMGAAGQADCIGGIAYPQHAFAVGMLSFDGLAGVEITGMGLPAAADPPVRDGAALLVVHEIGHLLGAHHHYGWSCLHPGSSADPARPCDVMDTLAPQQTGLRFGPVNAAVVRDTAERVLR